MKTFITMIKINIIVYILIYIIYSFIMWKLENPFLWIINIPTYNYMDRFGVLFSLSFWYLGTYMMISPKPFGIDK